MLCLEGVVLVKQPELVLEDGAEDDLQDEDGDIDQDHLVHRLLHRGKFICARLGVLGHLGVLARVDRHTVHTVSVPQLRGVRAVSAVKLPYLGAAEGDVLQAEAADLQSNSTAIQCRTGWSPPSPRPAAPPAPGP